MTNVVWGAHEPLSPYHQIRILIVLRDIEKYRNIYPIRINVCRYDGWDISDGPVYKSITRKLTKAELLPEEYEYEGKYGCVFYPFFHIGKHCFPGTKPLATNTKMWLIQKELYGEDHSDHKSAEIYYNDGHLQDMRYGFKVRVGNNSRTDTPVRLNAEWDENWLGFWRPQSDSVFGDKAGLRDDFPVSIDIGRKFYFDQDMKPVDKDGAGVTTVSDEKMMLSKEFLTNRTSSSHYYKLFGGKLRFYPFIRLPDDKGQGNYLFPDQGSPKDKVKGRYGDITFRSTRGKVYIDNFDWETPVEFSFLATAEKIDYSGYELHGINWKKIPFELQIKELTGIDTKGPKLSLRFHYVGYIEYSNNYENITFVKDPNADAFLNLKGIIDLISSKDGDSIKAKQIMNLIHVSSAKNTKPGGKRHIFAAHVRMNYESPLKSRVDSIRPFGDDKVVYNVTNEDNPYRYTFFNIKSADESSFNIASPTPHRTVTADYEFIFQAPKSYSDSELPWADKNNLTKSLTDAQKWIEDDATKLKLLK